MEKQIKFENGNLKIGYCDNSQDISIYESGEYTEPIRITFIPSIEMTEADCLKYTNENMSRIIEETKIVIAENNDFYKNFKIDFNSEFTGYNLDRNHLNRDLLIVCKSWMYLKCELSETEAVLEN